ncbi:conserved hypothetical protein [Bosea sp. 62]|jgi:hypothetical protein|uniref:hypothetical protein n=1 Tax=unclassified Bosea (in: a-proteobacteria) TaxID=2653178 RepID=UPI00125BCD80|nr:MULTISPECIES: hypothetical protein [unclassified Bosea (in: a-proteobacteria)]CAD5295099.1 conserved hypothetical protein [Bosea sp. 21B]CAD5295510.1 conserved hypothetical protein [Bosea sp. 46]CAD5298340.1 conserved hypothetical protein [Bosea sp. 7B]VVT60954.1 conserved hypothetical protein [Bosea sp. EC-HK365B]VXB34918.1 conserved hypothetical protein [Bosea sp. 127]
MPYSSLNDLVDVARAQAALDRAWQQLKPGVASADWERERSRLAYIIAAFAMVAMDEDDLVDRALERFKRPSP